MMAKSSGLQNEIIHQELANRRNQLAQTGEVFFMDILLPIGLGYMDWFDGVWLVYVDEKTQLDRLVMRNHYTRSEAQKHTASQMSTEARKAYADKLPDNRGNLQTLKEQVDRLLHTLSS